MKPANAAMTAVLLLLPPAFSAGKSASDASSASTVVTGGIFRFGEDIVVDKGDVVEGPVMAFGGAVAVKGRVEGPVVSFGGPARLSPGSQVDGPVLELPRLPALAKVTAVLVPVAALLATAAFLVKIIAGLGWLALSAALWILFPAPLRRTMEVLAKRPGASFLAGLFAWPCLGLIGIGLLVSLIGIPALPLLAALAVCAYLWGFCALAYWLGDRLCRGRWENQLGSLLAGALLLQISLFIPLARWLILFASATFGAGAATVSRFGTRGIEPVPCG